MLSYEDAARVFSEAEELFPPDVVTSAVARMAAEIEAKLSSCYPLVLSIMGGAVVFTGQLLPLLRFPLNFDYIHVSRYHNSTSGGDINWRVMPHENVQGRAVLVLDDILDEGITLAAIRERVLNLGAASFYSAVLADKNIGRSKPITADFVGLAVPNRYVFGFGMDIHGAWRNLPAIYALKG